MIHSNGSGYRAFFKHAEAATNRFFPKHIPTLFHSCAELAFAAATRCLTSAVVVVVLDDGPRGEDHARVPRVARQRRVQVFERAVGLAEAQIQKAERREDVRRIRRRLERFQVRRDGGFPVFLRLVHPAELLVRGFVSAHGVGAHETLRRRAELLRARVTQALLVVNLPILVSAVVSSPLGGHLLRLLVHLHRGFVLAQQVQAASHLLQVLHVVRVQSRGGLEKLQALLDAPAAALDQRLDVDGVLAQTVELGEHLLDQRQARVVLVPDVQPVDVHVASRPRDGLRGHGGGRAWCRFGRIPWGLGQTRSRTRGDGERGGWRRRAATK